MSRRCQLTGKSNNTANNVSHSQRKTKRVQKANIINKRFFLPSQNRFVRIKVSISAMRSIAKLGIEQFIKQCGARI